MDHDFKRLSWRDPDGYVLGAGGKIFRGVTLAKAEQIKNLNGSSWMARLVARGVIPETVEVVDPQVLGIADDQCYWLEHQRLFFPCYPHEITALQLYEAAELTLEVATIAAENGWTLKDASAWNVLQSEGRAVFVDILSFEQVAPSGTWIAYGQFVRHFILPLLLYRQIGMTPPEIFLIHRDGVTPEHAYRRLHGLKLVSRVGLEFVLFPKLLARAGRRMIASRGPLTSRFITPEIGIDLTLRMLARLKRVLGRLRPDETGSDSVWKSYENDRTHYSSADLAVKDQFVRQHLVHCETVLDLGCNAGEYSLAAAQSGKNVVSVDFDHPALSRLFSRVKEGSQRVTPVMLNVGRPTPAVGWRNAEIPAFLDRAAGQFDCILLLGMIHHLLVSERATLPMISNLLDYLNPKRVILEWIEPHDPKFQQLTGVNRALYVDLSAQTLESCLSEKFRLEARVPLPSASRTMYLWCR